MPFVLALALATAPRTAGATQEAPVAERTLANHVARRALVRTYDARGGRMVVFFDFEEITLGVRSAMIYGRISEGRYVDVSWSGHDATVVRVRRDRIRAWLRP